VTLTMWVESASFFWVFGEFRRLSHVVQLILDAEIESAKGLGVLVDRVLDHRATRYQFLDALLELSSSIARSQNGSPDLIFQKLSSVPRTQLKTEIDRVLGNVHQQLAAE
jgi:hypothetical protein